MSSRCNPPPAPRADVPVDPAKFRTQDYYKTCNLPMRFDRPYWFNTYGSQKTPSAHPFYKTTYMEIGWYPPNPHTVPPNYYPSNHKFTNHLGVCGMYRNTGLNTVMDKRKPGE